MTCIAFSKDYDQTLFYRLAMMGTIMYLNRYLDGCWMNALTILCMASV
jgi:hypothetical protein